MTNPCTYNEAIMAFLLVNLLLPGYLLTLNVDVANKPATKGMPLIDYIKQVTFFIFTSYPAYFFSCQSRD